MKTHLKPRTCLLLITSLVLACFCLLVAEPDPAYAGTITITVDTVDDENDGDCSPDHCSLRDAITLAHSGNTIDFDTALSGQTILLGSELAIDKNLTIDGFSLTPTCKSAETTLFASLASAPASLSRCYTWTSSTGKPTRGGRRHRQRGQSHGDGLQPLREYDAS